jgi:hypothetical protein
MKISFILFSVLVLLACARPEIQSGFSDQPENPAEKPNSSCQFTVSACPVITFEKAPAVRADSAFYLNFLSGPGVLASDVELISVRLWMPSMGHGSSPVVIEALGPGIFRISRVFFLMDKDWQIQIRWREQGQEHEYVENLFL